MRNFDTHGNLPIVLLIDDDMVSREVMATVLTMSDYAVHTAEDGAAGLELLISGKCAPGVILMDAQMPGLSGVQLIGELRALTQARIFAISASQPPAEITTAADGFLLKPFDGDSLGKLLADHHAEQQAKNPGAAVSVFDPNEPVINLETLNKLRSMMPESAVREIYVAVAADLNHRIQAIVAAALKGDSAEIRRLGHAIKGSCGMAGALQAARIGQQLESFALDHKGNHLDNANPLIDGLRTATRSLELMLDAELPA